MKFRRAINQALRAWVHQKRQNGLHGKWLRATVPKGSPAGSMTKQQSLLTASGTSQVGGD